MDLFSRGIFLHIDLGLHSQCLSYPSFMLFILFLTFYIAFNLGANDVANAIATSVGSKAISIKRALIIVGLLEFTGAVIFGRQVSQTLSTQITDPTLFTPHIFVMGMTSVLLGVGMWLQIATLLGLPVSSSHATVGAIAGFSWAALGVNAVNWSSLESIILAWIITPIISAMTAALFYSQIQYWIISINQSSPIAKLNEWIPWLSTAIVVTFGTFTLPPVTCNLTYLLREQFNLNIPKYGISILIGLISSFSLTLYSWRQVEYRDIEQGKQEQETASNLTFGPVERLFARYQFLSACFIAFVHGSNDVSNAIAPLATIVYMNQSHKVPMGKIDIPIWILAIGGVGIVLGLAFFGKKVIITVGDNIANILPSSGFCAEFVTAITILLSSRLGLPISTSHILVGSIVGVELVQNSASIQMITLRRIMTAWLITIPISASLGAIIFKFMDFF